MAYFLLRKRKESGDAKLTLEVQKVCNFKKVHFKIPLPLYVDIESWESARKSGDWDSYFNTKRGAYVKSKMDAVSRAIDPIIVWELRNCDELSPKELSDISEKIRDTSISVLKEEYKKHKGTIMAKGWATSDMDIGVVQYLSTCERIAYKGFKRGLDDIHSDEPIFWAFHGKKSFGYRLHDIVGAFANSNANSINGMKRRDAYCSYCEYLIWKLDRLKIRHDKRKMMIGESSVRQDILNRQMIRVISYYTELVAKNKIKKRNGEIKEFIKQFGETRKHKVTPKFYIHADGETE